MPEIPTLLDGYIAFDPAWDLEAFLRAVPARWAIYLFSDAEDRPVQLLCVKNLRASLKRRLGGSEEIGPSRRVNYRDVVRHVRFKRVDSAFEADWLYYEIARLLFPESYQGMVGFRPAWFIHVNPEADFPRYIKTTDLSRPGLYIGPVEDKHVAARLIHLVEDLFDLCRYYNILIDAPDAKACAYKEMGKCPAPCDGSISMAQYRHVIDWSARTLVDPADAVRTHTARMEQAAASLRFETAAKIKAYVEQLSQLGKGAYRYARWLKDFQFVAFQHGPRPGTVKVFLISLGKIKELACMIDEPHWPAELLGLLLGAVERPAARNEPPVCEEKPGADTVQFMGVDLECAERIGIVAHHLFAARTSRGLFIRLDELDEKGIIKAYRDLQKRPAERESELEGVLKELQTL
jgi:excinuclease UvrABC nuclease subunit